MNRRNFLTGTAGAAVAAIAVPTIAATHPDAELLAAYAEFVAWDRKWAIDQDNNSHSDDEIEVRYERWSAFLDTFEERPATTPDGLAVIALAALRQADMFDVRGEILTWDGYSRPPEIDTKGDRQDHILWNLIESAQEMARAAGGGMTST